MMLKCTHKPLLFDESGDSVVIVQCKQNGKDKYVNKAFVHPCITHTYTGHEEFTRHVYITVYMYL